MLVLLHAAELRRKKVSELEADLREADNVVSAFRHSEQVKTACVLHQQVQVQSVQLARQTALAFRCCMLPSALQHVFSLLHVTQIKRMDMEARSLSQDKSRQLLSKVGPDPAAPAAARRQHAGTALGTCCSRRVPRCRSRATRHGWHCLSLRLRAPPE